MDPAVQLMVDLVELKKLEDQTRRLREVVLKDLSRLDGERVVIEAEVLEAWFSSNKSHSRPDHRIRTGTISLVRSLPNLIQVWGDDGVWMIELHRIAGIEMISDNEASDSLKLQVT